MFEVCVETEFCAAHALVIRGQREPTHGHNWRLTVVVGGERLDSDELLLDFHALEVLVNKIVAPFRNADFNRVAPFDRLNPSAEAIARYIGQSVQDGLGGIAASAVPNACDGGLRLVSVRITEAPGCAAVYRP